MSRIFDQNEMNRVLNRMNDPRYVARLEVLADWYNANVDGLEGEAHYKLNMLCLQFEDEIAEEMGFGSPLVASDAVRKMGMRYRPAEL